MDVEEVTEIIDVSDLADISGTQAIVRRMIAGLPNGVLKQYLYSVLPDAIGFFWSVFLALVIYGIGVRIIGIVLNILQKALERKQFEKGAIQFISSLARAAMYLVLFVTILTLFGVSTSSIAAAIASIGLAAGLALQGSLANFSGGVLIMILKPFVVGDYIIEDTHGNEGTVDEISVFYTKLRTVDHKIIVIPNGVLANSSLTNATMSDKRIVKLDVSIGYNDDIKKAKQVLLDIVDAEEKKIPGEEALVYVDDLGESAVILGLRFWVPTADYWSVRWKTLEEIKVKFDEHGINIPYNQMDVHLVQS